MVSGLVSIKLDVKEGIASGFIPSSVPQRIARNY